MGRLEVLALGPLTNLALAIKLDPAFAGKVRRVVVMGACESANGNSGCASKFNFRADPEAASVVLDAFGADGEPKIVLVPWECTMRSALDWDFFDTLVPPANGSDKGIFLQGICTALQEHCRGPTPSQGSDTGGEGLGFLPCDAYAACVLEEPAIVVGSRDLFCGVELGGTMARGLSYFDWYGQLKDGQGKKVAPNVRLVHSLHMPRVRELFQRTFL